MYKFKLNKVINTNDKLASSLCLVDDILVSGLKEGSILVWKLNKVNKNEQPIILKELKNHTCKVHDVIITYDKKHIISGSWDGNICIWNLESGNCIKTISGINKSYYNNNNNSMISEVMSISYTINEGIEKVASVTRNGTIMIFTGSLISNIENNDDNNIKYYFSKHNDWITSCTYPKPPMNNDHNQPTIYKNPILHTAGQDGIIYSWCQNKADNQNLYKFNSIKYSDNSCGGGGEINQIISSPDNSIIASSSNNGILNFWEYKTLKLVMTYKISPPISINYICFNPVHYWCIILTDDSITLFCIATKTPILKIIIDSNNDKINEIIEYNPSTSTSPSPPTATATVSPISIVWEDPLTFLVSCDDGLIRSYSIILPTPNTF